MLNQHVLLAYLLLFISPCTYTQVFDIQHDPSKDFSINHYDIVNHIVQRPEHYGVMRGFFSAPNPKNVRTPLIDRHDLHAKSFKNKVAEITELITIKQLKQLDKLIIFIATLLASDIEIIDDFDIDFEEPDDSNDCDDEISDFLRAFHPSLKKHQLDETDYQRLFHVILFGIQKKHPSYNILSPIFFALTEEETIVAIIKHKNELYFSDLFSENKVNTNCKFLLKSKFLQTKGYQVQNFRPRRGLFVLQSFDSKIEHDKNKNFFSTAYHLTPSLFKIEKAVIPSKNFGLRKNNFIQTTSKIASQITLEDLTQTSTLINRICFLLSKHTQFVKSQTHTLNGYQSSQPRLDCDTTGVTLYCIAYKVQKKFPHHNIFKNLFFGITRNHCMCIIQGSDGHFYYADVNRLVTIESNLIFYSREEYLNKQTLSPLDKIIPIYQKETDSIIYASTAHGLFALKKMTESMNYFRKAISILPNNTNALTNLAAFEFGFKNYEASVKLYERLSKIYELDDASVFLLALSYFNTDQKNALLALMESSISQYPRSLDGNHNKAFEYLFRLLRAKCRLEIALNNQKIKLEKKALYNLKLCISDLQLALTDKLTIRESSLDINEAEHQQNYRHAVAAAEQNCKEKLSKALLSYFDNETRILYLKYHQVCILDVSTHWIEGNQHLKAAESSAEPLEQLQKYSTACHELIKIADVILQSQQLELDFRFHIKSKFENDSVSAFTNIEEAALKQRKESINTAYVKLLKAQKEDSK